MDVLRNFIKEHLLSERIRSKTFDMKVLESMSDFRDVLKYAKDSHLKQMGCGSSRCAFVLSSKWALKVALNKKGLAQNYAEVEVYTNPHIKPVVSRVMKYGKQYSWLISELVKPINKRIDFERATGIDFKTFEEILSGHEGAAEKETDKGEARPKNVIGGRHTVTAPNLSKNASIKKARERTDPMNRLNDQQRKWMEGVLALMHHANVMPGDLYFPEHWGKTPDGRVVLLDYGFTREVWKNFYKDKSADNSVSGLPDLNQPSDTVLTAPLYSPPRRLSADDT